MREMVVINIEKCVVLNEALVTVMREDCRGWIEDSYIRQLQVSKNPSYIDLPLSMFFLRYSKRSRLVCS